MNHNQELLGTEASRCFNRNRRLNPEELEIIRAMLKCRSRCFNVRFEVRQVSHQQRRREHSGATHVRASRRDLRIVGHPDLHSLCR
ncbi:hypothetical protein CSKR_201620 [Clonorchis sinensis]|uniref:Uncharacterized protein n=1 Tax=Clonorchis sinensis TaxID=79923 RepID=A0A8T1MT80_CLOSI|nr:hypothetical protein CSKR_201620 [Clonorchis sinensis]